MLRGIHSIYFLSTTIDVQARVAIEDMTRLSISKSNSSFFRLFFGVLVRPSIKFQFRPPPSPTRKSAPAPPSFHNAQMASGLAVHACTPAYMIEQRHSSQ